MRQPPVSYTLHTEIGTAPVWAEAFAQGCGGKLVRGLPASIEPRADFAGFCVPEIWYLLRQAQARGRNWYYGDHAYFGRRQYFRCSRNRYQHDGTGEAGPERFERFGLQVQPWRRGGGHILICPNSFRFFALHGLDAGGWIRQLQSDLRRLTDRELIVRWKPEGPEAQTRGPRQRSLAEDLRDAWMVIVFTSNAAVDALIAGVPVMCLSPFAAAARMGRRNVADIERPLYPEDREPFLWNLAANQWTLEEMRTGQAWRALQEAHVYAA